LCNIHNMAQIRLNTTERDVDLPRRADLRLNMAYLPKMLEDARKSVIMPKIATKSLVQSCIVCMLICMPYLNAVDDTKIEIFRTPN